jgi:hypothetical protein
MKLKRKTGGISRTPAQQAQFKAFQRKGAQMRKGIGKGISKFAGKVSGSVSSGLSKAKKFGGKVLKGAGKKSASALKALGKGSDVMYARGRMAGKWMGKHKGKTALIGAGALAAGAGIAALRKKQAE